MAFLLLFWSLSWISSWLWRRLQVEDLSPTFFVNIVTDWHSIALVVSCSNSLGAHASLRALTVWFTISSQCYLLVLAPISCELLYVHWSVFWAYHLRPWNHHTKPRNSFCSAACCDFHPFNFSVAMMSMVLPHLCYSRVLVSGMQNMAMEFQILVLGVWNSILLMNWAYNFPLWPFFFLGSKFPCAKW